jgi:ParB/RepB/Spo0J family partition protein
MNGGSAMQSERVELERLSTNLERVRCQQPALLERMKTSLQQHGQLTAMVAVRREQGLEILDGFKRYRAACRLKWKHVQVSETTVSEAAQWGTMLLLNRGPQSMTMLEEALLLKEMLKQGMSQQVIAELVQRHKSWVCRRIGLVQSLHPELLEQMKLGLLQPGVARRLLSLPQGNQLLLAAAAMKAKLGPSKTEKLVSAWQRSSSEEIRRFLLSNPLDALRNLEATRSQTPADPRLGPKAQRVQRLATTVASMSRELVPLLRCLESNERTLLLDGINALHQSQRALLNSVGRFLSDEHFDENDENDESA